jgi:hypothetical protein
MAARYRTVALPCGAPVGETSPLRRFGGMQWTLSRAQMDAPCQVVARVESACRRSGTIFQPVCRRCGSATKSRVLGSGAPIELRRVASGIGVGRSTTMSMTATATRGIKALIATITAAFTGAVARRARRRAPPAYGISRQTGRVRPEYLPALARSRLLRLRGLH